MDRRDDVDSAVEFDDLVDERARNCSILQIVATHLERERPEGLFAPRHLRVVRRPARGDDGGALVVEPLGNRGGDPDRTRHPGHQCHAPIESPSIGELWSHAGDYVRTSARV